MSDTVIEAQSLSIEYHIGKQWFNALRDIDLTIKAQEIHGLVGESGSGKSTLGLGLMRYLAPNARINQGHIWFDGLDLAQASTAQMRQIWGKYISLVPQNALDALNPSLSIGAQMIEITQLQLGLSKFDAIQLAKQALANVKIADPQQILDRYPHQLSGGMQQRVMIAMALSTRPKLLILDEPTTALDVTTQAVILDLVRELIQNESAAALYVSHDLGTVAQLCDQVTVLYAGEVMESSSVRDLFQNPTHPYTIGLMGSIPSRHGSGLSRLPTINGVAPSVTERPTGCVFCERCPVAIEKCHAQKPDLTTTNAGHMLRCWRASEIIDGTITAENLPTGIFENDATKQRSAIFDAEQISKKFTENNLFDRLLGRKISAVQAVQDVSLHVNSSTTIGIVGESGSGKTTLARALLALITADSGSMQLLDRPLSLNLQNRDAQALMNLRMIFQNPHDALNPYKTIGQAIGRTYRVLTQGKASESEVATRVNDALQAVGLTPAYAERYPNQLSGGEKQRIAIARAFVANPALIIADEPTSSLDVSIQATILNLLKDLRAQRGASYIIISHDLEVIRYLADWVIVMYLGEVMEQVSGQYAYQAPMHPYTEALLSAVPMPDPEKVSQNIRLDGDVPSPRNKPTGCPFHTRCPRCLGSVCIDKTPPVQIGENGQQIRCHIPLAELQVLQTTPQEQV